MSDVIAEYQQWKQKGGDLRAKAKLAMEARFRELLQEAVKLSEEYRADFGPGLKPPPAVTSFRYKAGKPKKTAAPKPASVAAPAPAAPAAKKEQPPARTDPKLQGLQKRLAAAQKKLEVAQAAGKPTRDLEDRVYEIEDALRVAGSTD